MALRWTTMVLLAAALPALAGCQTNPYYNPAKPHHTPEGFRNVHTGEHRGGFLKWRWDRLFSDVPPEPRNGYRFEVVDTAVDYLAANGSETTVTWIGHATVLLQVGGVNILTDPILTPRASPVSFMGPKRKVPAPVKVGELPPIDVVVISHNHYDHLDRPTVAALAEQPGGPPRYFVPLGLKEWFAGEGITTVTELDWWQGRRHMGVDIYLVPAQHFSTRTPFNRNESLWGGWVVEHPDLRFYYAGDAGYSPHFREIGLRFGPIDLAALPIGAYEPRWFMKMMHMNPSDAVQAHQDLGARYSLGVHWGTFEMTDEAIDEPPRALARALDEAGIPRERFFVMKHGETRLLAPLLERRIARRKRE